MLSQNQVDAIDKGHEVHNSTVTLGSHCSEFEKTLTILTHTLSQCQIGEHDRFMPLIVVSLNIARHFETVFPLAFFFHFLGT